MNLGNLYPSAAPIDESLLVSQTPDLEAFDDSSTEPLYVALVKLRAPQVSDDATLQGIGYTLSQLSRLGLSSIVVIDCRHKDQLLNSAPEEPAWRRETTEQAGRVVTALEYHGACKARHLDNVIEVSSTKDQLPPTVKVRGRVRVTNRGLLLTALRREMIPVVTPVGHNLESNSLVPVSADEIVLALAREFAGLVSPTVREDDPSVMAEKIEAMQKQTSVDRIIVIDPLGGIPSTERSHGSHVFINLEQEYEDITHELSDLKTAIQPHSLDGEPISNTKPSATGPSNPISSFLETDTALGTSDTPKSIGSSIESTIDGHVRNLHLIRDALAILPPSSSALLTTPQEVAHTGFLPSSSSPAPDVSTRRQKNLLIHNLMTDKPIFSSSLPAARLGPSTRAPYPNIHALPTTFAKRGMPLTIIPNPHLHPWTPPSPTTPSLQLSDPRIDFSRLAHLIDDSFGRPLDRDHYLSRISNRVAGIIIAGSYEGGAILTWESPPGNPTRYVPYLDKFAVLKRAQGTGGVADVVFSAMVRDCFPQGVCWRSRQDNPVNKWYFERSKGTTELAGSGWTMFWTTEGVSGQVYEDYEAVCRSVVPSWADRKEKMD